MKPFIGKPLCIIQMNFNSTNTLYLPIEIKLNSMHLAMLQEKMGMNQQWSVLAVTNG